jgi:hypothetical protein
MPFVFWTVRALTGEIARNTSLSTITLGARHAEVIAYLVRQELLDDAVSRDGREQAVGGILVDCVLSAFPHKDTALRFEMSNQISTIHFKPREGSVVPE